MSIEKYKEAIVGETKRRIIGESIPRIKTCLSLLTIDQIWYRPNENSNAVGNLILHLCGNVRQWIMHGLDYHKDNRDRDYEFSETGPLAKSVLIDMLDLLTRDLEVSLGHILQADLLQKHTIQKHFEENGISILIHVIEHFSYHTGQITYYTKWVQNIDTKYYGNLDL